MTKLYFERKDIGKNKVVSLELSLFEAPIHFSNSAQRRNWQFGEIPFFEKDISKVWSIYGKELGDYISISYTDFHSSEERIRFIKSPQYVASLDGGLVLGGIWRDSYIFEENKKGEVFHIIFSRFARENYSQASYELLKFYLEDAKKRVDFTFVGWGERDLNLDPSNFFKRNGFKVGYGEARYDLSSSNR